MAEHDFLRRLRTAARYRQAFSGPIGEAVLADLFKFCCVGSPTTVYAADGKIDPLQSAENEGKRRVALRIAAFLKMDPATTMQIAMSTDQSHIPGDEE